MSRVLAVPGLEDVGNKNTAEEKKRAYQFELQRQVCPFDLHVFCAFTVFML